MTGERGNGEMDDMNVTKFFAERSKTSLTHFCII